MILKYDHLWPDHPFIFHVPYQELRGTDTDRVKYHAAPEDIKGTILHLQNNRPSIPGERMACEMSLVTVSVGT